MNAGVTWRDEEAIINSCESEHGCHTEMRQIKHHRWAKASLIMANRRSPVNPPVIRGEPEIAIVQATTVVSLWPAVPWRQVRKRVSLDWKTFAQSGP